ncbi:MAG: DUF177 domain-containing protein [Alphaproteobacteria bacterium]|nr:DUF177 domain-containing protein [Alphaproteobacteria bacterium]
MNEIVPEFSRPLSVARLPPQGAEERLEAKPTERKALAERFDLVDLRALKAQLNLTPEAQHAVIVTGIIEANYIQRCVVTLEPIETHLDLKIDVTFFPEQQREEGEILSPGDEIDDEVEFYAGGKIDIGELVAQQLGVAIDPYPRKADATLTRTEFGAKSEKPHPLAALTEAVKNKRNKEKTEC